jgi:hypothetical protein
MTKRNPVTLAQPSTDAQPSNGEPSPAPSSEPDHATCFRCGLGSDSFFGEVVKDPRGWWLHSSCRRATEAEAAPWKR